MERLLRTNAFTHSWSSSCPASPADQRISGSADQGTSGSADQQISRSADRTKRSTDQLVHGFCKALSLCTCQLLSTHAPFFRSLQVHSPRNCTFDKLVHVISNIMIYVMYVLLAAILHIVWRLGSVVWGTLSYSERCHSELDVRPEVIIPSSSLSGLAISPRRATPRRATILTATQIHVHACHQQHHDYIMYALLAAILHIVWRLGFEEPYPTLSVVIQCCLCGLRSSLPRRCLVGNFTKAGNLPVVRRRLQVSPQYNDMRKHAQRFFGCDHCRLTCQGIVLASHGNEMCF